MNDKHALMALIRSLNEAVCELPEILESDEDDGALAFLEACQDIQEQAGRLIHAALLPTLKSPDLGCPYSNPEHPNFGD
jgi:hypothetical protein